MKQKKEQFNCRLPPDLLGWFQEDCKTLGISQATAIEELLEAKRSGRLIMRPTGPDAFPGETIEPGTTPYHPILIGIAPGLDEPDEVFSEAFPAEVGRE